MIKCEAVFDNNCIYINDKYWISVDEPGEHRVRRMGDDDYVIFYADTLEQAIHFCLEQSQ